MRAGKRRLRKTSTLLRYVRNSVKIAQSWNALDRGTGNHWVEVNQELFRARGLISELHASLAAPGGQGTPR